MVYRENEENYIGFKPMSVSSRVIEKQDSKYLESWFFTWSYLLYDYFGLSALATRTKTNLDSFDCSDFKTREIILNKMKKIDSVLYKRTGYSKERENCIMYLTGLVYKERDESISQSAKMIEKEFDESVDSEEFEVDFDANPFKMGKILDFEKEEIDKKESVTEEEIVEKSEEMTIPISSSINLFSNDFISIRIGEFTASYNIPKGSDKISFEFNKVSCNLLESDLSKVPKREISINLKFDGPDKNNQ